LSGQLPTQGFHSIRLISQPGATPEIDMAEGKTRLPNNYSGMNLLRRLHTVWLIASCDSSIKMMFDISNLLFYISSPGT
jgi:hypothetical protein